MLKLLNATIADGVPQKSEHNDLKWITPSEFHNDEFCQVDKEILEALIKRKQEKGKVHMTASEIFQECIGKRIPPLVIKYEPYKGKYETFPFRHTNRDDFETAFSAILFDAIVFYAYEKNEIEYAYERGKISDLHKAARSAYESRVPKTESLNDGLIGELALDSFIKCFFENIELLYSRVKYYERYPQKEVDAPRKGHEIKGYDGLLFSLEKDKKHMWIGQVKTGTWDYCFRGIKEDINKSILKHYFASAMAIMADIMMATSDISADLKSIIDALNDILFEHPTETEERHSGIVEYFKANNIVIRIPCLIIAEEHEYSDSEKLLSSIKRRCTKAFDGFCENNDCGLDMEIMLMVFPVRNLQKLRQAFLDERICKKSDGT